MAEEQKFLKANGDPYKDGYHDHIKDLLARKLEGEGIFEDKNNSLHSFLKDLSYKLGWGYSDFDPYTSGNYAVFMQHGPWLDALRAAPDSNKAVNYISSRDKKKIDNYESSLIGSLTNTDPNDKILIRNFSRMITDIDLPEPSKEYIAISTRQKNSFINTREFAGSDFTCNYIDNKELDVFKYHEAWHKSIELIREGLLFARHNENKHDYLIQNPNSNAMHIVLFEPKTYNITGLITLFGILPVNLPFKNLVGDRGGPKVGTYAMQYKFMDMQYAFYSGWDHFAKSAEDEKSLAYLFTQFASISQK